MKPVRRSRTRTSQQFHPAALVPLEARIALSTFAHPAQAGHAMFLRTPPTPSILSFFPTAAAGLAAGNQVSEQWTATYYDGTSQIDDQTFVLHNQTVTVTENITLRGAAGSEKAVDRYAAIPGGVMFQNTLTLPNGQTETETRTDIAVGTHEIIRNGSFERPDGVTVTFTTSDVFHGTKAILNSTFHESNGITYTVHEVDVNYSPWQSSATVTTKWPDGSHQVNKNTVTGELL